LRDDIIEMHMFDTLIFQNVPLTVHMFFGCFESLLVAGTVQYYCDIWHECSHILSPATNLSGGEKSKGKKRRTMLWYQEYEQAWKPQEHGCMLAYNFSKFSQ
jgi:hypothetical protein